jgi:putative endonuclease
VSYKVYILKNQKVERYYIGSTENLKKRIEFHNSSSARWTKRYQPWVLMHFEEYVSRSEAVRRERFLKSLKSIKRFLKSTEQSNSAG